MPELPEVQTIVDDLNKKVKGRRIVGIWFDWPKMLKDPLDQQRNKVAHAHVKVFQKVIVGKRILRVKRRAKNILIYLSGDLMMLIHLKMTGHLLIGKWQIVNRKKVVPLEPKEVVEDPYNQYVHLIFYLDNGNMLGFSDVRKFGKVVLGSVAQIENLPELTRLGPEPLDPKLKFAEFANIISRERRKIKQALMDPRVIAGIGNIYSDDILWKAKIHPLRRASTLDSGELRALWAAMRTILKKALSLRGTSSSDYRDTSGKEGYYEGYRLVYQREGEPCKRCGAKIKRIVVGGRSAHHCPRCQGL
jgi:formamidopyrimidine-DNA glycosylase